MNRTLIATTLLFLLGSVFARMQGQNRTSCNPERLTELMLLGDLAGALTESQSCVAGFKSMGAKEGVAGPAHEEIAAVYMCANAQIEALRQRTKEARKEWDALQSFLSSRKPGDDLMEWDDILAGTEGLLLEKEGKLSAAKEAYKKCLATSDCNGRLATIALDERDYQEADRWAQLGARRKDAAAYVVLGVLSQMRGDDASAAQAYDRADYLMKSAADRSQFLPIYFAEQSRLKHGLEWVCKRKQSALRN